MHLYTLQNVTSVTSVYVAHAIGDDLFQRIVNKEHFNFNSVVCVSSPVGIIS